MVVFPFSLSLDRQLSYDNSCLVVLVVVASMLEYCTVVYYVQLVKSLLVGYGWFSLCGRSSWYDTIRYTAQYYLAWIPPQKASALCATRRFAMAFPARPVKKCESIVYP